MKITINSVNAKEVFFTNLSESLEEDISEYSSLINKIDSYELTYLGDFESEEQCINFYFKFFNPIVKYEILPYKYLFTDEIFNKQALDSGEKITRNAHTEFNRMDEISPINASLGEITTPSFKVNNANDGNSTDSHTKISDYQKIYREVCNGVTWADFIMSKFKRCIKEFYSMY